MPDCNRSIFLIVSNRGHDVRFVIMCPVVQDTKFPRDDEERRLLADYESCHTEKLAATDQLSNPRHSNAVSRIQGTSRHARSHKAQVQ